MTSGLPDGMAPLALVGVDGGGESPVLHAGTSSGLYIKQNPGGDWQPVHVPGAGATPVTALAITSPENGVPVIHGGVNGGVIQFDPRESTWTTVAMGSPPPLVTCIAGCGQRLLAGTLEDGVFQSDDGGATWRSANIGLLDMSIYWLTCVSGPNDREIALAATETTVFISENGGRTWQDTGFDAGDVPVQAIVAVPASDLIVAGTGGAGLFRTTMDTGSWVATGEDLPSSHVVALHLIDREPGGPAVVAVLDTGIAVSTDGATTWQFSGLSLDSGAQIVSSCLVSEPQPGASLAIGLDNGIVQVIHDIFAG